MEILLVIIAITFIIAGVLIIKFPKLGSYLIYLFPPTNWDGEDIKKLKRQGKRFLIAGIIMLFAGLFWPCEIWGCAVPF